MVAGPLEQRGRGGDLGCENHDLPHRAGRERQRLLDAVVARKIPSIRMSIQIIVSHEPPIGAWSAPIGASSSFPRHALARRPRGSSCDLAGGARGTCAAATVIHANLVEAISWPGAFVHSAVDRSRHRAVPARARCGRAKGHVLQECRCFVLRVRASAEARLGISIGRKTS